MSQVSSMVKDHRKASGLTQLELAEIAGVGKTTVFDIEKGKETVRFINLTKVLDALNIKIKFIRAFEGIDHEES
ncbi:MAG: type II toxin-antitoxin system Y4mF family antitoxin [Lentisphaerales bacterium]|nr:type II toxin-antitoxin system Y4mF family antitoxin [Lentisphaerales bacterium]